MPPRRRRSATAVAAAAAATKAAAAMEDYDDLGTVAEPLDAIAADLTCALCSQLFTRPCTLPCAHTFCRACVEDTLRGKGVYKNECPDEACTHPVYVKDLRVNRALECLVLNFPAMRATAEADERERGNPTTPRAASRPAKEEERAVKKDEVDDLEPAAGDGDDARAIEEEEDAAAGASPAVEEPSPKRAKSAAAPPAVNTPAASNPKQARCRVLEEEIATIDAHAAWLDAKIAALELEETRETEAARSAAAAIEAAAEETQTRRTSSLAAATAPPTQPTQSVTQPETMTLTQARSMYAAAHGRSAPKKMTLKKLRRALEKLDKDVLASVAAFALAEEDGTSTDADAAGEAGPLDPAAAAREDEAREARRRERRKTNAAAAREEAAALVLPPGESRRKPLAAKDDNVDADADAAVVVKAAATTRSSSPKVFEHTQVSTGSKRKAGGGGGGGGGSHAAATRRLAAAVEKLRDGSSFELRNEDRLSRNTTHLLMDLGGGANDRVVSEYRTVRYLEAILRGIWILRADYALDSAAAGRWLNEADYEIADSGRGDAYDPVPSSVAIGPAGGRERREKCAPGVFAGEVAKARLSPETPLLVKEIEGLLIAGGATLASAPSTSTRGADDGSSTPPPASETEQGVPDSEDEGEDVDDVAPRGVGVGGGGVGGGRATTIIVDDAVADADVRALEEQYGGVVVTLRWLFHSIVHHVALPKEAYSTRTRREESGGF